jgi:hypothetical protein
MATDYASWSYTEQSRWFSYPGPNDQEWIGIATENIPKPEVIQNHIVSYRMSMMPTDYVGMFRGDREVSMKKMVSCVWQLMCSIND